MLSRKYEVFLITPDRDDAARVQAMLSSSDGPSFTLRHAGSLLQALDSLAVRKSDILLLDLSLPDCSGIATLSTVKAHLRDIPVIVWGDMASPELARAAVQLGAHDYLVKADITAPALVRILQFALLRQERPVAAAEPEPTGVAIGVIGGKGGVGTTTLACHLSAELRGLGPADVLLADLDLYAGQVAFLMKAISEYSVVDGLSNLHRLDGDFWASLVAAGAEDVKVICSPRLHEQGGVPFPAERLRYLVRFLKTQYERIVVDLGRMNALSLGLVADMNSIVVVTTSDMQALYETGQLLATLGAAGVPKDHVHLVVNRTTSRMLLPQEDIEKVLHARVETVLPNSETELADAYTAGTLLPHKTALRRHIARLAAELAGCPVPDAKVNGSVTEYLKGKLRQLREDASACSAARNSAPAESGPS